MAELVYQNQGATRDNPVSDRLGSILTTAAQRAGIDEVRVISGGQEPRGASRENIFGRYGRTGSVRHDRGNAADIKLVVDGRVLDFTKPADQAIFSQFVTAATALGATGIGAGTNYMGPQTIHVGFGAPATWGAGGKSAGAPEWLRTAYAAGQSAPATQTAMNVPRPNLSPASQVAMNGPTRTTISPVNFSPSTLTADDLNAIPVSATYQMGTMGNAPMMRGDPAVREAGYSGGPPFAPNVAPADWGEFARNLESGSLSWNQLPSAWQQELIDKLGPSAPLLYAQAFQPTQVATANVPMPRLAPSSGAAKPAVAAPAVPVQLPANQFGADRVVAAILANDDRALTDALLYMQQKTQGLDSKYVTRQVQTYIDRVLQQSPQLAPVALNNINGNPEIGKWIDALEKAQPDIGLRQQLIAASQGQAALPTVPAAASVPAVVTQPQRQVNPLYNAAARYADAPSLLRQNMISSGASSASADRFLSTQSPERMVKAAQSMGLMPRIPLAPSSTPNLPQQRTAASYASEPSQTQSRQLTTGQLGSSSDSTPSSAFKDLSKSLGVTQSGPTSAQLITGQLAPPKPPQQSVVFRTVTVAAPPPKPPPPPPAPKPIVPAAGLDLTKPLTGANQTSGMQLADILAGYGVNYGGGLTQAPPLPPPPPPVPIPAPRPAAPVVKTVQPKVVQRVAAPAAAPQAPRTPSWVEANVAANSRALGSAASMPGTRTTSGSTSDGGSYTRTTSPSGSQATTFNLPSGNSYTQVEMQIGDSTVSTSSKVLCTHYMRRGWLDRRQWLADVRYSLTVNPAMQAGYLYWAAPLVRWLERGTTAGRVVERILWPVVRAWSAEMAHKGEPAQFPEGSTAGRIVMATFGVGCLAIGHLLNAGKSRWAPSR